MTAICLFSYFPTKVPFHLCAPSFDLTTTVSYLDVTYDRMESYLFDEMLQSTAKDA